MSRMIRLGQADHGVVSLDVDLLLRTHMLIQANTGGGKSHLVRLMAERISGVGVQTIIIDPEGEFASLREEFPFLLAGKGGDVPASPVSAALLARRLLELRASAVLDLFELNKSARIAFVAKFLEAMIEAPRALWHNVAIFLDEGQMFAPESSEAFSLEAVTSVATRGRKRGYGLIVATPRLSDFSKSVASQLQNVAVGPTFMDLDLKRAAMALSIGAGAEQQRFFADVKVADPGQFIALGRAISKARIGFLVDPVVSAHPETSDHREAAAPPPAPAAIRKLLVHLQGLEDDAATEAHTVEELQAQVADLRSKLAGKAAPPNTPRLDDVKIQKALARERDDALKKSASHEGYGREAGTALRGVRDFADAALIQLEDKWQHDGPWNATIPLPMPATKLAAMCQGYPMLSEAGLETWAKQAPEIINNLPEGWTMEEDQLYQKFKARLIAELPALLKVLSLPAELEVTVERRVVEADGNTLKGRLALLFADGWFAEPKTGNAAFNELTRIGFRTAKPNVYKALDELATLGIATKETDGYRIAPGAKVNIKR